MGSNSISVETHQDEPNMVAMKIKNEEGEVSFSADWSYSFKVSFDIDFQYEDGDVWQQSIDFIGSPQIKEALLPSDLKVGDALLFYPVSISNLETLPVNTKGTYFIVKE